MVMAGCARPYAIPRPTCSADHPWSTTDERLGWLRTMVECVQKAPMSDAILMLRLEHENIASVIDLLEDQLQRLESGAPSDHALLLLAVEYLKDFPEACHHPKEDLLLRVIQRRDPQLAAPLANLCADHERLGQQGWRLRARARRPLAARPPGLRREPGSLVRLLLRQGQRGRSID